MKLSLRIAPLTTLARHRLVRAGALLATSALLLPLLVNLYVMLDTYAYRSNAPANIPAMRVAIVFGAGISGSGTPSPMLADRVRAASELYKLGRVEKLLMTGDNSRRDYDEVSVMRSYAIGLGVPSRDITLDYAGFSTYESCYRARMIFGVTSAVLISQRYHLPRAVYTCRALGIAADGLGTPDWQSYGPQIMLPYTTREMLATLKALWQLHVSQPLPTFLGPFEGISSRSSR